MFLASRLQWVSVHHLFFCVYSLVNARHIHVSLRDSDGNNVFAVPEAKSGKGREGAKYDDTKFISEVAERFLAGILDGLPDG